MIRRKDGYTHVGKGDQCYFAKFYDYEVILHKASTYHPDAFVEFETIYGQPVHVRAGEIDSIILISAASIEAETQDDNLSEQENKQSF